MQNNVGKTALGLDNNVGALVCYLNVCLPFGLIYSIIVLVTDKTNKLPRFHAFQSIILTVAAFVISIPCYILIVVFAFMSTTVTSLLSGLVSLVMSLVGLALLVFIIIAAFKAFSGEIYKIPVIGNFAEKYANG